MVKLHSKPKFELDQRNLLGLVILFSYIQKNTYMYFHLDVPIFIGRREDKYVDSFLHFLPSL
jgi:hypothetical protein